MAFGQLRNVAVLPRPPRLLRRLAGSLPPASGPSAWYDNIRWPPTDLRARCRNCACASPLATRIGSSGAGVGGGGCGASASIPSCGLTRRSPRALVILSASTSSTTPVNRVWAPRRSLAPLFPRCRGDRRQVGQPRAGGPRRRLLRPADARHGLAALGDGRGDVKSPPTSASTWGGSAAHRARRGLLGLVAGGSAAPRRCSSGQGNEGPDPFGPSGSRRPRAICSAIRSLASTWGVRVCCRLPDVKVGNGRVEWQFGVRCPCGQPRKESTCLPSELAGDPF